MKNQNLLQCFSVLLPTEDASKLQLETWIDGSIKLCTPDMISVPKPNWQHLYLTSKRKIKEGDWVYSSENRITFKANKRTLNKLERNLSIAEKIELTSDPKLIADGVLAIPGFYWKKLYDIDNIVGEKKINFLKEFIKRYNNKNVKEVDVEKLADEMFPFAEKIGGETYTAYRGFMAGYNKALQDNVDKKFSLDDMRKALKMMSEVVEDKYYNIDIIIDDIQSHILQKEEVMEMYLTDGNIHFK